MDQKFLDGCKKVCLYSYERGDVSIAASKVHSPKDNILASFLNQHDHDFGLLEVTGHYISQLLEALKVTGHYIFKVFSTGHYIFQLFST